MNKFFERIAELAKSRIFLLLCGFILLFLTLTGRLFYLQIIHGEQSQQDLKLSIMRELTIPASRGNIYDRYGRPLAANQVAFSVKIDDSITSEIENKNEMLYNLVVSLEEKGEAVEDTLPITQKPYSFTFPADDKDAEKKWKQSVGLDKKQLKMSAEEAMAYLENKFDIPSGCDETLKRKIISLGIAIPDKNLMLASLIQLLEENNETMVDEFPISSAQPYTFLFDGNDSKEQSWKEQFGMRGDALSYNAAQTVDYLVDYFDIPENLSYNTKRKILSLRYNLYQYRYKKYQPVTVALEISSKTVANLEEKQDSFPGVMIDTDSLRTYPLGEYFSHILGYIRKISDTEFAEFQQNGYVEKYGYTQTDIVGKSGIEKVKETALNGEDGKMLVEVDNVGRRISTIETKQPVSGKDVFLTIDEDLQVAAYDYLEETLTDVLISKLTAASKKDYPITLKQFFISMVQVDSLSLKKIMASADGQQMYLKQIILDEKANIDISEKEDKDLARQILTDAIETGRITSKQLILCLVEQGKITADENYLNRIQAGAITPLSVVIEKLRAKELRPSDTDLDPCSGSVVVSDVNTGETLALVTYPSYDNNELVNNFNNEYYNSLLNNEYTTPLVNRPLSQNKAPGSTFKMITAIAGLESGTISPNTTIRDEGTFTKTGIPYAKCWIAANGTTHGSINVSTALEVSCNYFFYELAYRMGNASTGDSLKSIATLNEYMDAFGLNSPSGIEIGGDMPNMASPDYKEYITKMRNPDATTSQTRWVDGDTIRTAIGQSVNNYAPVHMTKYIATLANGGTRYKMHLIDKVENPDKTIFEQTETEIENILQVSPKNLEAVYEGMRLVTQGPKGTLRGVFSNFPVDVAAKSGTAQENLNRSSHTWFVGFAPYDEPQISVTVMIPYGEASSSPAAVVAKKVIAEYMGLNYVPENNHMDNVLAQ